MNDDNPREDDRQDYQRTDERMESGLEQLTWTSRLRKLRVDLISLSRGGFREDRSRVLSTKVDAAAAVGWSESNEGGDG